MTLSPEVQAIADAPTGEALERVLARLPGPVAGHVADAIEAGYVAVERLPEALRHEAVAVLRDRKRAAADTRALEALTPGVGIAVVAIGTDDPERAIEALCADRHPDAYVRGEFVVHDGYLYAEGFTSAEVQAALRASR